MRLALEQADFELLGARQDAVAVVAAAAAAAAARSVRLRVLLLLLLLLRLPSPLLRLGFASSRASTLHRTLHLELRRLRLQLHLRVVSCVARIVSTYMNCIVR